MMGRLFTWTIGHMHHAKRNRMWMKQLKWTFVDLQSIVSATKDIIICIYRLVERSSFSVWNCVKLGNQIVYTIETYTKHLFELMKFHISRNLPTSLCWTPYSKGNGTDHHNNMTNQICKYSSHTCTMCVHNITHPSENSLCTNVCFARFIHSIVHWIHWMRVSLESFHVVKWALILINSCLFTYIQSSTFVYYIS